MYTHIHTYIHRYRYFPALWLRSDATSAEGGRQVSRFIILAIFYPPLK